MVPENADSQSPQRTPGFGIASLNALLPTQATAAGKVIVAKPGENCFPFSVNDPYMVPECKVTKEDSAGACSIFELVVRPQQDRPGIFIIAKTNGITSCQVNSSSRLVI